MFQEYIASMFQMYCLTSLSGLLFQEAYKQEGLKWKEIDFADNSGCIDLYEKKPMGLFYLMDEK